MLKQTKKSNKKIPVVLSFILIILFGLLLFSYSVSSVDLGERDKPSIASSNSARNLVNETYVAGVSDVAPTELSDEESDKSGFFSRTTVFVIGGAVAAVLFVAGLYYAITRLLTR